MNERDRAWVLEQIAIAVENHDVEGHDLGASITPPLPATANLDLYIIQPDGQKVTAEDTWKLLQNAIAYRDWCEDYCGYTFSVNEQVRVFESSDSLMTWGIDPYTTAFELLSDNAVELRLNPVICWPKGMLGHAQSRGDDVHLAVIDINSAIVIGHEDAHMRQGSGNEAHYVVQYQVPAAGAFSGTVPSLMSGDMHAYPLEQLRMPQSLIDAALARPYVVAL